MIYKPMLQAKIIDVVDSLPQKPAPNCGELIQKAHEIRPF
jgi:hypothetical protein